MYYLNEDGKRVYTLKVRDDDDVNDYQSAARFLFLFLSFFAGETCMWRFVDLRRVVVVVVCVGTEEEDFGGFLSSRILLILSLTIFFCECRRRMRAENRAGWETNPERAPGSIQPGR